jgi:hypothetical protein
MAFIKVRRSGPRQSRTSGRFLDDVIAPGLCFGSPAGSQIGFARSLRFSTRRYPVSDATPAALSAKAPPDQQGAVTQNVLDHQADNHRAVGADLRGHLVNFSEKMAGKRTPTMGSWPVRGRPRFRLRFPMICVNTKFSIICVNTKTPSKPTHCNLPAALSIMRRLRAAIPARLSSDIRRA